MELYNYIPSLVKQGVKILTDNHIVIYNMDMRTGKTPCIFETCKTMEYKNVLFITRKSAMSDVRSIYNDVDLAYYQYFDLTIINYEMLHSIDKSINYDFIVVDECHNLGAITHSDKKRYNKRQIQVKEIAKGKPIGFLSGTLTPETWSQIWHILRVSDFTPFEEDTFTKFALKYVNIKKKYVNGYYMNDYTDAKVEMVMDKIKHLIVEFSQMDAEFNQQIQEYELVVPTPAIIKEFALMIMKDAVIDLPKKGILVLAETASSEKSKLLQIASGTIIDNNNMRLLISDYKVKAIKEKFGHLKIAIFYNFQAEKALIEKHFKTTDNHNEFNINDNLTYCKQITSGAEGVNIGTADIAVFLNIHYSGRAYTQVRQRINFKDRAKEAAIWFILSELDIEKEVLAKVRVKADYTNIDYNKYKFEKLRNIMRLI